MMIEGKLPQGRPSISFIGRIEKDAGAGSYNEDLKRMANNRSEGRGGAVNKNTGR